MTLDILICSIDKGIVRIVDVLLPPQPQIRYLISYQYTDERYLELIPEQLVNRSDVLLYKYKGQGLAANRNLALERATSEYVMCADDDTRISPDITSIIEGTFSQVPDLDIAFYQASTYTGKPLKNYPDEAFAMLQPPTTYSISTIEMVCRRNSIQGKLRFDERFGLGTKFLTCGEEEIWLHDALRFGLKMHYFPVKVVETSTMLKKTLIYVDAGVQRSRGAFTYYMYGQRAWWHCLLFALRSTRQGRCHFWPMMRHLAEGIRYMQRTQ